MGVKIVSLEAHLDPIFRWLPFDRAIERRRDFYRAFKDAVNYAIENHADLFILPGDVFHVIRPRNAIMVLFARELLRLRSAGIYVFAVPGHHDMPKDVNAPSPLSIFAEAGLIRLFDDIYTIESKVLRINDQDVTIYGFPYDPNSRPGEDPLSDLSSSLVPREGLNILILHYQIEGFPAYSDKDPIIRLKNIPEFIDLVVAGHIHKHLVRKRGNTTICYVGTAERVDFKEEKDPKGFTVINAEPGTIEVEHVKTRARTMKTIELNLSEEDDITEFVLRNLEKLASSSQELKDALIRIVLKGTTSLDSHRAFNRIKVKRRGNELFFGVKIDEKVSLKEMGEVIPVELETPIKELKLTYQEMINKVNNEEEKLFLEEAYELARKRLEEAGGW